MMFMDHRYCIEPAPLAVYNPTFTAPANPLQLRQLRRTLPSGVEILCVAVQAQHHNFTYSLVVMPGFEGGGRAADGSMAPRTVAADYTPKLHNTESQKLEPVWPPLAPTLRLINGREYDGTQFPETPLTRRMEQVWCKAEPLMRQLCNLLQAKLDKDKPQVSYTVLVERIKQLLEHA